VRKKSALVLIWNIAEVLIQPKQAFSVRSTVRKINFHDREREKLEIP
jgi:hypothetical protein